MTRRDLERGPSGPVVTFTATLDVRANSLDTKLVMRECISSIDANGRRCEDQ